MTNEAVQMISVRVPLTLNLRLDAEVLRRRCETGKRVSRAELLAEILNQTLPEIQKQSHKANEATG